MAISGERALRRAIRLRVVLRYLGELGLAFGITALVPTLAAAAFGEYHLMAPYGFAALLFLALGVLGRRMPRPRELQVNEALVVTATAFVLTPLVMSGPLAFQGIAWIDAVFEAVSGVTTTGLSTLSTLEGRPRTFLLGRAWMQWVGGLGFVVLSVALTLGPGIATRRLGAPSLEPAQVVGGMREHARRVLRIYLVLTGVGIGLLFLLGASGFDAVLHTLSGISTGGFSPRDTSLAELDRRVQAGVLGLCLLGAISLPLYAELGRRRWSRITRDPEARMLLLMLLIVGSLVILGSQVGRTSSPLPLPDLATIAISAQTGAGFSTLEVGALPALAQATLILSMLTGGSVGSTTGGIKLLRLLLLVRLVQWLIAQTRLPAHAVSGPELAGHRLEAGELLRAAVVVVLFLTVLLVSWLPFLAYGYAPLESLFEVASALGTVGLSTGISRHDLEPVLKGILCTNMLLGRLEIFAVLVLLAPRTWLGRRAT